MIKYLIPGGCFCMAGEVGKIVGRLHVAALLSLILLPGSVFAVDLPKTQESLQKELQHVQQQIEEARTNLTAKGKALWSQQHDVEYNDPECVKLREEVKALEVQLVEKRQQLSAKLKTKEPIRAIENQRRQLVETLRALLDKEKMIMNEITALDSPEGVKREIGK